MVIILTTSTSIANLKERQHFSIYNPTFSNATDVLPITAIEAYFIDQTIHLDI